MLSLLRRLSKLAHALRLLSLLTPRLVGSPLGGSVQPICMGLRLQTELLELTPVVAAWRWPL